MRYRNGLTLFESLAVMIVISMLLGVSIPAFRSYQKKAMEAKAQGEIRLLAAALKAYHFTHHEFPATSSYQQKLINSIPQIIDGLIYDPFAAEKRAPYTYKLSPNHQYFILYSIGILGNVNAIVSDNGKVFFLRGDPAAEIWGSNGSLP
jgi:type II secretory pathway pseudopilin PulG